MSSIMNLMDGDDMDYLVVDSVGTEYAVNNLYFCEHVVKIEKTTFTLANR